MRGGRRRERWCGALGVEEGRRRPVGSMGPGAVRWSGHVVGGVGERRVFHGGVVVGRWCKWVRERWDVVLSQFWGECAIGRFVEVFRAWDGIDAHVIGGVCR